MRRPLPWKAISRAVAAAVAGYALIVALTTLGLVGWLDDADLYRGGWLLKAQGTLVAVVAGLAGGSLAALVGRRRPLLHAAAVLPFLVVDTGYVLFFFPRPAPAWFELAGGLALMTATLAGGWMVAKLRGRDGAAESAPPAGRGEE